MNSILDTIIDSTRRRVDAAKGVTDTKALARQAHDVRASAPRHEFSSAVRCPDRLNIIAEFKKASPSKGVINDTADPSGTARSYECDGAIAISVLTEPDYFHGSLDDLRAVRSAVSVPILRKDFFVDEFQILEAAAAGADAILLIVAALTADQLLHLRSVASGLGMDALVEVHNAHEMETAAQIGADLIGVNNRDLRTFEVSLDVSRELVRMAPGSAALVTESGIKTRDEIVELKSLGYAAFLIGETLMRGDDLLLRNGVRQ